MAKEIIITFVVTIDEAVGDVTLSPEVKGDPTPQEFQVASRIISEEWQDTSAEIFRKIHQSKQSK